MPIIDSLGALSYPKIVNIGLDPLGGWATLISRTGIVFYTRNISGAGSVDTKHVVCVDDDENIYIHASTIPTTPPYVNSTRYLIQLDGSTGGIGSFLFSQGGQGFTAINPIASGNNDVYFPFDQYISGSGGATQIQNALEKTAAGSGATGYDVGTGSSNGGSLKKFMSGKQNQDGMFLLSYTTEQINGNRFANVIGYGCTGINCTTPTFAKLTAFSVGACVSPAGEVVMKLQNGALGANNITYIGNVDSSWAFETTWEIFDMVSDSSYVYATVFKTGTSVGQVIKIDITNGSIVDAITVSVTISGQAVKNIVFGDDGYLYVSVGGSIVKLDTNLNLINSTAIDIGYYIPPAGPVNAGAPGPITVKNGYIYSTFGATTGNIIAIKIPNNNSLLVRNRDFWLGSGVLQLNEYPVTVSSYPTANIVFSTIDATRNITFTTGSTLGGTYGAPTVSTSGTVDTISI